jgi:uracil-DNA glycosylase
MSPRSDLDAHLEYFGELGVDGVSRDPIWREREIGMQQMEDGSAPGAPRSVLDQTGTSDISGDQMGDLSGAERQRSDAETSLQALRAEIGPDCTRCKLAGLGRRQIVFGVGNPNADLMFVGEAPGADEDVQGEPFVGRAGQLLTKIIEAIDLKREDVYIANVIKCRPPGNRAPEADEVATCEPFLFRQIDTIRPKVIVALGTHAAHALLKTDAPISRLRGRVHDFRGGIKLVPTFHPAFLLRSPDRKRDVWDDMKKVRDLLKESSRGE